MGTVRLSGHTGDGGTVAALKDIGNGAEVFDRGIPTCRGGTAGAVGVAWGRHREGQRCDERREKEGERCHWQGRGGSGGRSGNIMGMSGDWGKFWLEENDTDEMEREEVGGVERCGALLIVFFLLTMYASST